MAGQNTTGPAEFSRASRTPDHRSAGVGRTGAAVERILARRELLGRLGWGWSRSGGLASLVGQPVTSLGRR